jgi:hypothetical protein
MNYLAPFTSSPGDFVTENTIDSHSVSMLNDAFKAVDSTPGGWDILARPDVPGSNGFMFSEFKDSLVKETMEAIDKKIDSGHSGASYGWTMRNMESIAKNGWEVFMLNWRLSHLKDAINNLNLRLDEQRNLYAVKFKLERLIIDAEAKQKNPVAVVTNPVTNPVANLLQQARTVDSFLNTQAAQNAMANPLVFATAAQKNPGMRAMIPDIDNQVDAISRFSRGEMSYAEMRSLCG